MNILTTSLMSACIALAAGSAGAQDATKKNDTMPKEEMMKKDMTMQECKDHMEAAKKDGAKKDDAMMKHETMCNDMMKKDADMMKKNGTSSDPVRN